MEETRSNKPSEALSVQADGFIHVYTSAANIQVAGVAFSESNVSDAVVVIKTRRLGTWPDLAIAAVTT